MERDKLSNIGNISVILGGALFVDNDCFRPVPGLDRDIATYSKTLCNVLTNICISCLFAKELL